MIYRNFLKRLIDIAVALIALLVLFPLFLITSIVLFIKYRKVFFIQIRTGLNCNNYKLVKFKTMTDRRDNNGDLLPDHKRLDKFGVFLRNYSIDELPQLFNVIAGHMSIVGPRPLLPEYVPLLDKKYIKRYSVKPGITGLAQINGRNNLLFSQRFSYDIQYINNISFWNDLKILCITLKVLISSKGVVNGQFVDDVDDLGITKGLSKNNFKNQKL